MPSLDPHHTGRFVSGTAYIPDESGAAPAFAHAADVSPLVRAVLEIGRSPRDHARAASAAVGVARCVAALVPHVPIAHGLLDQLSLIPRQHWVEMQPKSTSVIALAGRKTQFHVWAALIELGQLPEAALTAGDVRDAMAIMSAHLLRAYLSSDAPLSSVISRSISFVRAPHSASSSTWSARARSTSLSKQVASLVRAISENPDRAMALSLIGAVVQVRLLPPQSRVDRFNAAYRLRLANVAHYADDAARRGTPRHGSLTGHSLLSAGRSLRRQVETGNETALLMALEIMTGLSPATLTDLPIGEVADINGGAPLAWLSPAQSKYVHTAYWLVDQGAKPPLGTEGMYERSTSRIEIALPEFVAAALGQALEGHAQRVGPASLTGSNVFFGDVVTATHHPWVPVDGDGRAGVRITVARVVKGLTAALLNQGVRRATCALLLSAQHLISPGSKYYGVVAPAEINDGWALLVGALGWDEPDVKSRTTTLVGSAVTPSTSTLYDIFDALARAVDQSNPSTTARPIAAHVNALSAWVAAYMALCLALRESTAYPIMHADILAGKVVVDDKRVHTLGPGPALPIIAPLAQLMRRYWDCIRWCAGLARKRGDEAMASLLETSLRDQAHAVNRVDGSGSLRPVGHDHWQAMLPPRQFSLSPKPSRC